jgi:hypothetical protein
MKNTRVILLPMFGLLLLRTPGADACNSGSVRDAAFEDRRDMHRLVFFSQGAAPADDSLYAPVEAWFADHKDRNLNLRIERINGEAPGISWEEFGMPAAPPVLPVTVLAGTSRLISRPFVITHWDPAPESADLDLFFASPSLKKAKETIVDEWAVVLYAPADGSRREELETALHAWSEANPPGVSMAEIDRSDPAEKLFRAVANIQEETPDTAGVLFGKCKLMAPLLKGEEINQDNIHGLLGRLAEPCTCMEDAIGLGLDLPVFWEPELDRRFAELETAARGYREITFEEQVQGLVEEIEEEEPGLLAMALIPLAAMGLFMLLALAVIILRARRPR